MRINEFCRLYDINVNVIQQHKSIGSIPKDWFYFEEGITDKGKLFNIHCLNENKIIDRYEYKQKIINLAHANYYFV